MQLLNKIDQQRAQLPIGASRILNTRSLKNEHQRLTELLQPGMAVLDLGCGPGSITRDMAKSVMPNGQVVGIDINPGFIEEARHNHSNVPNLSFELGDIYNLPYDREFDIVIAARIFHWLSRPFDALKMMIKCAKPGSRIVVHDCNLEKVTWQPSPPDSMKTFYTAFLKWRAEAGMDNAIADHLSEIFEKAGLVNIVETPQHQLTKYTDPDFETRIGIWADIAAIKGPQMVQDGAITKDQRLAAEVEYREWVRYQAKLQNVYFTAVEGVVSI
ncbi:MAG: methyltransferase domain-containing protein [Symploca sp. SIO1C4]|uniref:Methyltransferase domain-containing protein n=1 Tax=Symploca sp. SIO1C4 TaxID=2607765 RepID=A0A6B3NFT9_9CYAN|nr:methyltransferase domain-containing protein [Symploca sp. SIO1C4]